MRIVDQLPTAIDNLCHVHTCDNVITIASCDAKHQHVYVGDSKVDTFACPNTFTNALVHLMQKSSPASPDIHSCLHAITSCLNGLDISNGVLVGWLNNDILIFDASFSLDVDDFKHNILSYVRKKLTAPTHVVAQLDFVVLLKHETVKQDLYISMFGLEACKLKSKVLLFFLKNGQIWFEFLDRFRQLNFLYSVGEKCLSGRLNSNAKLVINTAGRKTVLFQAKNGDFDVETTKLLPQTNAITVCKDYVPDCNKGLTANGCYLVSMDLTCAETVDVQLQGALKEIKNLHLQRKFLEEQCPEVLTKLKVTKKLAEISAEKSGNTLMSYFENDAVCITIGEDMKCDLLVAVCSQQAFSHTFETKSKKIILPLTELINSQTISCYIVHESNVIYLGAVQLSLWDCLTQIDQTPNLEQLKFSMLIYFNENFAKTSGDIFDYVIGKCCVHKQNCTTFSLLDHYVNVKTNKQGNMHVVNIRCSHQKTLKKLKLNLLEKILEDVRNKKVCLQMLGQSIVICNT